MPQPGETVAEGKISKWFKAVGDVVGPTTSCSRSRPTRLDGGAGDERGHPDRDPRAGRRDRAGADRGRGPVGRGRKPPPRRPPRRPRRRRPQRRRPPPPCPFPPRPRRWRARSTRSTPWSRRRRTSARPPWPTAPGSPPWPAAWRPRTASTCPSVKGSGPHGRIVAADVAKAPAAPAASAPAAGGAALATGPTVDQVKALYADVPYEEIALDGMRKVIAAAWSSPNRPCRTST